MALADVIGQESALRILRGALERGRLASSYLFAGEEGIGKRFTAFNLAKALNCLHPSGGDACGRCPSCRKMEAGTHLDFKVVEPDGDQIKVEQIREIEEILSLKPYEGGVKALVVDDAERMNTYAANAFLKTLEEPSPQTLIVLVSANPDWLPLTIRSRCSRVNFTPLSPADCEAVIRKGPGSAKPEKTEALVRLSMGRPGLVLREDPVKERDKFFATLRKMVRREGRPAWRERSDMQRWLEMSLVFLRDLAVCAVAGGEGGRGELVNTDMEAEIVRMAGGVTVESVMECYGKMLGLVAGLRFNPNKAITWNYAGSAMESAGIVG
ncbi:MAG: DNA polymerase III subunit delta' [Nitrospirota bacterium]|jgi:DNA polymerase-3 subunit delta'